MKKDIYTRPLKGMVVMLTAAMLFTSLPDMHVSAEEVTPAVETSFSDEETEEAAIEKAETEKAEVSETSEAEETSKAEPAEEAETAAGETSAEISSEEENAAREANGKITPVVPGLVLLYDTDAEKSLKTMRRRSPIITASLLYQRML